jgi:hypothetical protein
MKEMHRVTPPMAKMKRMPMRLERCIWTPWKMRIGIRRTVMVVPVRNKGERD